MFKFSFISLLFTILILFSGIINAQNFIERRDAQFVSGITISSPAAGSKFSSGDNLDISFCADTDIIYVDAVNLTWITGSLICSTTFNIELLTNIKFEPNKCQTLTCKIPQNVQPDARYVALITYNNTTPISGSFFINNPDFGLIVTNPISNTDAECGNKLKVEWKDPFSKYQDLDLEIVLTTVKPPYFISSLASSVPVSSGEQIVTLPQGLENRKDYNIVLRVNRTDELGTEVYTSIFTIDGC